MSERTALYRLFGDSDRLLYVGVSHRPEGRWVQHARDKDWWPHVAKLTLEWFDTRAEALQAEIHAIKAEHPEHNAPSWKLDTRVGPTANRVLRVDDDLWREYGEACAAEGTTRSNDLRSHMRRRAQACKEHRKPDSQAG